MKSQGIFDNWITMGHVDPMQLFVLRNGVEYKGAKFTQRRGTPKECYKNATEYSLRKGSTYVEGFACSKDIQFVFQHAWCIDEKGIVQDNTLHSPEKYDYFGVSIPKKELLEQLAKNDVYGILDTGRGINMSFFKTFDLAFSENYERHREKAMKNKVRITTAFA